MFIEDLSVIREILEQSPIFKKRVFVEAERVASGTAIETILSGGFLETVNITSDESWLITQMSGEQYIIEDSHFRERYESTDSAGIYRTVGRIRAVRNPYKDEVSILASWGERGRLRK